MSKGCRLLASRLVSNCYVFTSVITYLFKIYNTQKKLENVSLHFGKPKRMTTVEDEGLPLHMMVSTVIKRDSVTPENSQYMTVGQSNEISSSARSDFKNSQFIIGSRAQPFRKNKWPYQRSSFGNILHNMEDKTKQMYKSLCGTTGEVSDKVRITRKMVIPNEVNGILSSAERNFTELYGTGQRIRETDNGSITSDRSFEFSPTVQNREIESSSSGSHSPPLPFPEEHNSPRYLTNEELFMHSYRQPRMYKENNTKKTNGMTSFKFQPVVTDRIPREDFEELGNENTGCLYENQITGFSPIPYHQTDDWEDLNEQSQHSQIIQQTCNDKNYTFNEWSPDYCNSTMDGETMSAYDNLSANAPLKYFDCYDDFMF